MDTKNLPELLDSDGIRAVTGCTRGMSYKLLNRPDTGVVQIGRRKYLHRETFMAWLATQAHTGQAHRAGGSNQ